jgi:hypothetical protein
MSNTNTKQWQPPHRISRTWQSKSTAVIEHWNRFTTLSAHLIQGGVLWAAEGKAGVLDDVTVSKALLSEYLVSIGDPDR